MFANCLGNCCLPFRSDCGFHIYNHYIFLFVIPLESLSLPDQSGSVRCYSYLRTVPVNEDDSWDTKWGLNLPHRLISAGGSAGHCTKRMGLAKKNSKSNISSMSRPQAKAGLAICIKNAEYRASLELRK